MMKIYGGAQRSSEIVREYPRVDVRVGKKFWKPAAPVVHIYAIARM